MGQLRSEESLSARRPLARVLARPNPARDTNRR
jgi:hypothetical protein